MKLAFLPLTFVITTIANAAQLTISPERMQPSSMALVCDNVDCVDSLSKFKMVKEIQPSPSPIPLKKERT